MLEIKMQEERAARFEDEFGTELRKPSLPPQQVLGLYI